MERSARGKRRWKCPESSMSRANFVDLALRLITVIALDLIRMETSRHCRRVLEHILHYLVR